MLIIIYMNNILILIEIVYNLKKGTKIGEVKINYEGKELDHFDLIYYLFYYYYYYLFYSFVHYYHYYYFAKCNIYSLLDID